MYGAEHVEKYEAKLYGIYVDMLLQVLIKGFYNTRP